MLSEADNSIRLFIISSLYYMIFSVGRVNGNVMFKMINKVLICQIIKLKPYQSVFNVALTVVTVVSLRLIDFQAV